MDHARKEVCFPLFPVFLIHTHRAFRLIRFHTGPLLMFQKQMLKRWETTGKQKRRKESVNFFRSQPIY